jgi:hypothetical protein
MFNTYHPRVCCMTVYSTFMSKETRNNRHPLFLHVITWPMRWCPSDTPYVQLLWRRVKGFLFALPRLPWLSSHHYVRSVVLGNAFSAIHRSENCLAQDPSWIVDEKNILSSLQGSRRWHSGICRAFYFSSWTTGQQWIHIAAPEGNSTVEANTGP